MIVPVTNGTHLARLRQNVDTIDARCLTLVGDLTEEQLLWRPATDRWGIADCFEHLLTTGGAYYPRVSAALSQPAADRARWEAEPYRATWFGRWFVAAAGPEGRSVRARGPFIPPSTAAPDAPQRFLAQQETLRELLRSAEGCDLRAIRIHSPLSRLLTLRLGECLELLVTHELRHVAQAERVRAESGFPD